MTATPSPGPVTPDDVLSAVDAAVAALTPALDTDWHVPAGALTWTCWETVEHIADDLFAYAIQLAPRRPPLATHVPVICEPRRDGGPASSIFAEPDAGPAGLLQVLEGCGALLAAMVRATSPKVRAHHIFGAADPEGFAAMGVVEVLAHLHDVAAGLGLPWQPDPALCARVRHRLFPAAPADTDPWAALLWATGRGELPGRPVLTRWRWEGAPRSDQA
ncbi:DinB family protein [Micromonospora sp. RTGN7]|uniref:DinB family protein n=1 Tax=Micromonospora sp. RTGN7 TaxID=3016526 RepID=UPI0029FED20E|nr:DinB family protein [Micromonospora sp. RTGN7]